MGAGGARPRLRRWCASFSSPRSRRADPRLAPTKNNRRQRHGPAKRQRRDSAADAKSPLRLLLMGRVEPPDCHDQELFRELIDRTKNTTFELTRLDDYTRLDFKKTQTAGVLILVALPRRNRKKGNNTSHKRAFDLFVVPPDEELRAPLEAADLAEGHGSRAEAVRLPRSAGMRGGRFLSAVMGPWVLYTFLWCMVLVMVLIFPE